MRFFLVYKITSVRNGSALESSTVASAEPSRKQGKELAFLG